MKVLLGDAKLRITSVKLSLIPILVLATWAHHSLCRKLWEEGSVPYLIIVIINNRSS